MEGLFTYFLPLPVFFKPLPPKDYRPSQKHFFLLVNTIIKGKNY